jgi:tellurite resistance-related uncharacterized protein
MARLSAAPSPRAPAPVPYRSTALFDEETIPIGLRRAHSTKPGVWGVIRILEGRARLFFFDDTACRDLDPDHPGLLQPGQLHALEPVGAVRLQIDFYDRPPPI